MIGDHADLNAANTRVARDHLFRVVGLKLVEMTIVEQTLEQFSNVVRLSVIFRNDVVQLLERTQRFARLFDARVVVASGNSETNSRIFSMHV